MRAPLSIALAMHIGQPLTVDVARKIVEFVDADRSIDVAQFAAEECGPYRIQCEKVADIRGQLEPEQMAYRAAFAPHLDGQPYPWNELLLAERAGGVLQSTARTAGGDLVGLIRVRILASMDSPILQCIDDCFYVRPDDRAAHPALPVALWRHCERAAFSLGVREAHIRTVGTQPIARYLGYRKAAEIWTKSAHDACGYTDVPTRHTTGAPHEPLAPN